MGGDRAGVFVGRDTAGLFVGVGTVGLLVAGPEFGLSPTLFRRVVGRARTVRRQGTDRAPGQPRSSHSSAARAARAPSRVAVRASRPGWRRPPTAKTPGREVS